MSCWKNGINYIKFLGEISSIAASGRADGLEEAGTSPAQTISFHVSFRNDIRMNRIY